MSAEKRLPAEIYVQWLNIPEDKTPPDHYSLLGVEQLETDVAKIGRAANERSEIVHPYCRRYRKTAIQLLNEIARAGVCLTDPEAKRKYDEILQSGEVVDDEELRLAPIENDPWNVSIMSRMPEDIAGNAKELVGLDQATAADDYPLGDPGPSDWDALGPPLLTPSAAKSLPGTAASSRESEYHEPPAERQWWQKPVAKTTGAILVLLVIFLSIRALIRSENNSRPVMPRVAQISLAQKAIQDLRANVGKPDSYGPDRIDQLLNDVAQCQEAYDSFPDNEVIQIITMRIINRAKTLFVEGKFTLAQTRRFRAMPASWNELVGGDAMPPQTLRWANENSNPQALRSELDMRMTLKPKVGRDGRPRPSRPPAGHKID